MVVCAHDNRRRDAAGPRGSDASRSCHPGSLTSTRFLGLVRRAVLWIFGTMFALIPIAMGNLWLLAHGVPVGFQTPPILARYP